MAAAILPVVCFSEAAADQSDVALVPVDLETSDLILLHEPTDFEMLTIHERTYVFILENDRKDVHIIDITDPTTPNSIGVIQDTVFGYNDISNVEVMVKSGRAYLLVFKDTSGFNGNDPATPIVIDVTNPTKPVKLRVEYIPELYYLGGNDRYGKVFEQDGHSFVIIVSDYRYGDIQTFDFTNPTKPTLVSDWSKLTGYDSGFYDVNDIDVVELDGRTYAFPHADFMIVDIDDPWEPTIVSQPDWHIDVRDIVVIDRSDISYAVVLDYWSLHTIDVTDPHRPKLVDSVDFSSAFIEVFDTSGRTLAITWSTSYGVGEVQITDITNPTSPSFVGKIPYYSVRDLGIIEVRDRTYVLILGREFQSEGYEYLNIMEVVATGSTTQHTYTMNISNLGIDYTKYDMKLDDQTLLTADITNNKRGEQHFTFLIQVQDEDGMVVDIGWTTGSMDFGEAMSLVSGFTPPEPGLYTVTAFVWKSLNDPTPLAAPISLDFMAY